MKPKTYIIILNWNGWQDTLECLESVFRLDYDNYQVIVCDNDSQDDSLDHIRAWSEGKEIAVIDKECPLPEIRNNPVVKPIPYVEHNRQSAESGGNVSGNEASLILIKTGHNLGFAGGNNVGLRYALQQNDFDYVWLLNNDTVVDPHCLARMVDYTSNRLDPSMCGSRLLYYDDPDTIQALGGARYNKWTGLAKSVGLNKDAHEEIEPLQYEQQISYIMGASWLIPKSFLAEIGLMEESYFLYNEEIDWCVRGNKYNLCYADDAVVYHKEGRSIGSSSDKRRTSLFSDYYLFSNKLDFTFMFYPEAIITVYLVTFVQVINRLRRGQWSKARLILNIMLEKIGIKPVQSAGGNTLQKSTHEKYSRAVST